MLKNIFVALLLLSFLAEAQHTVKGSMQPPKDYTWVALYKLQGAKQDYIANATIENGQFELSIPQDKSPGIYRLVYDLQEHLFVDLIYNNEDISLTFHPKFPSKIIKFKQSFENNIYQNYLKAIVKPQEKLDSLQVVAFSLPSPKANELYIKTLTGLIAVQQQYEGLSKGKLAEHFIKASLRYNTPEPLALPADYLNSIKKHFFDAIDFDNPVLLNSTFINDKINDYIFYLNSSDDKDMQMQLRKEAITDVITRVGNNYDLLKDVQEGLLYTFTQQEDIYMVNFLLNYYLQLPKEAQDIAFINDLKAQLRTAVGMKAPAFEWQENGLEKELYKLNDHQYYIIVFWSSTCSHCLEEMPVFYTAFKDLPQIKVLAVGLEDEASKAGWEEQIAAYPNFINIYGKDKWDNKASRAYGVNATPTFFVLDAAKKIIAKPDDVEELKVFFKNIPTMKSSN